jgi:hypothetical protein
MRRLAVCLSFSSLLLGCVVHVSDASSGDQPDEPVDAATPSDGSVVTTPEAEGQPPTRARAPERLDCPADADADTYCTQDGKLAGRWVPVDTLRPPAGAQPIFEATLPDLEKQPSLVISLVGATLYIKHVSCGSCRRVIGQGFSGELDTLSDEQLRALQSKLGLAGDSPLLDSPESWRSFCGQDPGKATLTKLAAAVSG